MVVALDRERTDLTPPRPRTAPVVRAAVAVDRVLGHVDRVALALCCVLLVGISADVLVAVFFRYVLNSSLMWAEEVARYGTVWLVFLGLSCAHRRGEHVSVQSLLRRLPRVGIPTARVVTELTTTVVCAVVAYLGWEMTMTNFERGQVSPALGMPISWVYLSIPVGFALMAAQSLVRAVLPAQQETSPEELD